MRSSWTCSFCGSSYSNSDRCGCAGEIEDEENQYYYERRQSLEDAITAARKAGDEAQFVALCSELDDLVNGREDALMGSEHGDYNTSRYDDDPREPDEPYYTPEDCDYAADRYFGRWS